MMNFRKVTFFCFLLVFSILALNFGKTYAMEQLDEKIKQAMDESHPEQYEMNIVLWVLDIKHWHRPFFESGMIWWEPDEPLGEYSPEKLQEYTDRDLEVKINYGFGHMGERKTEKIIQAVRIYEKGEMICCSYYIWSVGFVDDFRIWLKYPKILQ